jgi:uncharacterized protein (TIGR02466 family)
MHEFPWYEDFANQVKDTYIEFIKGQWDREVQHLNRHDIHLFSWVSVYEEGIEHTSHNHASSLVSGTYYPANEGGQGIHFHSPHIQSQFIHGHDLSELKVENMPNTIAFGQQGSHQELLIVPVTGETFMWPSNLLHSVPAKSGDFRRVAISFNLKHNDPMESTEHGTELSYEFL